ncbi:hypothetical protein [Nocardioides renjunii]|uniref:hypothetical protein n=1 Tax=Nocardioides renjunii TaxID=3095075 RepID=UPI002AFE9888|nr:hypothetical protein [Nocardioides sp. S-34]WQQ21971.1 hypothetical protein SHK17_19035 [Nocardioides sp. S-34]
MTANSAPDGSISDKAGLGAFLAGLLLVTLAGILVAPGFSASFCGLFVDANDPVRSITTMARDSTMATGDNSDWALNQVGMCVDSNALTGERPSFPSTFALAFMSMMLGLLGGLTALAGRLWPSARRMVPQALNEVVAGGSLGLAGLALGSMLSWGYAFVVLFGLVASCLVIMWILRRASRWLAVVLLSILVLALGAFIAAETSSSRNAWDHALVVFVVLTLLAAAAIVTARVCSEFRLWRAESQEAARAVAE